MNTGSDKTTNGIRVRVYPQFISDKKNEDKHNNYFAYTVVISNTGPQKVKLLSRRWLIINSEGITEEVIGEGVVGNFPELNPGESFKYTSFCPLNTDWGTMEGEYQFIDDEGKMFLAEIGRFYLISPQAEDKISI